MNSTIYRYVSKTLCVSLLTTAMSVISPAVHAGQLDMNCDTVLESRLPDRTKTAMMDAASRGELFRIDTSVSSISFSVKHFPFSTVAGSFGTFDGGLMTYGGLTSSRQVAFVIRTESVSTGNDDTDEIIKIGGFFDTTTFPDIVFVSSGIEWIDDVTARVRGELTVRNVTRPTMLEIQVDSGSPADLEDKKDVVISATTLLSRSEFGMDDLALLISDTVELRFRLHARRVRI